MSEQDALCPTCHDPWFLHQWVAPSEIECAFMLCVRCDEEGRSCDAVPPEEP